MTVLKGSLIPFHITRAPCCHLLGQSWGKTEKNAGRNIADSPYCKWLPQRWILSWETSEKSQLEDRNAFWVLKNGKDGLRSSEEEEALVEKKFDGGKRGWCRFFFFCLVLFCFLFCFFVERTRTELLVIIYYFVLYTRTKIKTSVSYFLNKKKNNHLLILCQHGNAGQI